jgi:hypothetical protein
MAHLNNPYKIQCVNSIVSLKRLYFYSYYIHSCRLILDKQLSIIVILEICLKRTFFINNKNEEIDYEHVERI